MFFDEEMLLDLRLNILDKYVDKFVISEATYKHNGKPKKLLFDINKFQKFKDKIIYVVADNQNLGLTKINEKDSEELKISKRITNSYTREVNQENKIQDGILKADSNDIIIMSDLDEIPNLEKVDLRSINKKLIFFKQKMFYYKFNLLYEGMVWYGSKACKKKHLITPHWLKWIKNKKYPWWRLDTFFSKKKYRDIHFVSEGGWHFTNIRKAEDVQNKLLSFAHHYEFEQSGMGLNDIEKAIKDKIVMYDHNLDKRKNKYGEGAKLKTVSLAGLPNYIMNNTDKYKSWLDI
tara:strand:+ start:1936 stop:2808 length:873 start_codon:yes stop_codon:yes gene_type:complete